MYVRFEVHLSPEGASPEQFLLAFLLMRYQLGHQIRLSNRPLAHKYEHWKFTVKDQSTFFDVCNGSSPRIERLDFNATLPGNVSEKECKKKQQYRKLRKKH